MSVRLKPDTTDVWRLTIGIYRYAVMRKSGTWNSEVSLDRGALPALRKTSQARRQTRDAISGDCGTRRSSAGRERG